MEIKLIHLITNPDWQKFFEKQTRLPYWEKLENLLQQEIQQGKRVYPLQKKIFRIFNALSPQKIKVMILGQDPYHQKGQADRLGGSGWLGVFTEKAKPSACPF